MATISKYTTAKGVRHRVRYRTPDGKQTDARGFRTKKEAEIFANTVEVQKLRGEYVAPSAGLKTVGQVAVDWLAQKQALKPSSTRSLE